MMLNAKFGQFFQGTMQNDPNFSFLYLQVTGVGAKSLTIPSQNSSFNGLHSRWLASLASWAQYYLYTGTS